MTPPGTDWQEDYPTWALRGLMPLRVAGEKYGHNGQAKTAEGKEPYVERWQSIHEQRLAVGEGRQDTLHDMQMFVDQGRNIGCVIPLDCVVLDWDDPKHVQMPPSVAENLRQTLLNQYPDAAVQQTPSGGLHLWFRVLDGEEFTATTKVEIDGWKFDVRSGGRSQVVVAPSSGLRGAYTWLRPLPPDVSHLQLRPNALIQWATDRKAGKVVQHTNYGTMPERVEKPAVKDYKFLEGWHPELYAKIKASAPLTNTPGQNRNNAMTAAVGAILGTMTAQDMPPHPEAVFKLLATCVQSDTSIGPDGGAAPTLAELWSICCRLSDRERPEWQARRQIITAIQDIKRQKHEQVTAETTDDREYTAQLCTVEPDQLVKQILLLDISSNFWVLDIRKHGYQGPLKPQALLKYLEDCGTALIERDSFYSTSGRMRPVGELVRDFGQQVRRLWYDSRVEAPIFNPRECELVCPAWRMDPQMQPARDKLVEMWLSKMAGDSYEILCDWLASVPVVQYPLACLYLHGPTGIGKTLFVEGLSRMWSGPAVPFRHAVADFNSGLLASPLIFVEEGLATDTDSQRFRDLLTAGTHDIRIKYEAPGELRGHVRMVVAANNPNALKIKEDLTHSDREAISKRILWIECSESAQHFLTSIGGRKVTESWVRGGAFGRHVLWLHQQRGQRLLDSMDRLLVPGNSSAQKTRMLLTRRIPASTLRIIVKAVYEEAFSLRAQKTSPLISADVGSLLTYRNGTVEVRWQDVERIWKVNEGTYGRVPTVDQGEMALDGVSASSVVRMRNDVPHRFFVIDRDILLEEVKSLLDEASAKKVHEHLFLTCRASDGTVN